MKLKNIFIVLAALAIFAACSNENDPASSEGKEAKLAVSVEVLKGAGSAATTADSRMLEGEATINNLTVVAYKQYDQTLLALDRVTGTDIREAQFTVASGNAIIAIIANTPTGAFGDALTYDDFKTTLASLGSQSQTGLTMSSMMLTGEILAGDNYIGYSEMDNFGGYNSPIVLTRIAARIEVNSIKTNFVHNEKLVGRQVVIEEIYLTNSKNRSLYYSEKDWGAVEVDGNLTTSAKTQPNRGVTNDFPYTENSFRRYTLENSDLDAPTRVAIRATLKEKDKYPAITKLFLATVNANGEANGNGHNFIRRNYIYDLSITFGDNSFEVTEPDDFTSLDVALQVVPWGTVRQAPEL